ncbi:Hypothetical protein SRM_00233 [Salinibacter ruber M8]|uniref:Uncharacterized protein n=1 Tax=Salinibacter ruber (strain M8) TaxID=761659 RepID=D5H549_SALRM|nr:Hypothetical protein SRM_00233 [Salinibacter ruber M8]
MSVLNLSVLNLSVLNLSVLNLSVLNLSVLNLSVLNLSVLNLSVRRPSRGTQSKSNSRIQWVAAASDNQAAVCFCRWGRAAPNRPGK